MNDVRAWSQALIDEDALTFDCWVFPESDRSDIQTVSLAHFINQHGIVERSCKLAQPEQDAYSALRASCGPKANMVISWKCEPEKPANIAFWQVRIVQAHWQPGDENSEDSQEIAFPRIDGQKRKYTIKLDLDKEDLIEGAVRVCLVSLDSAGNEIKNSENQLIYAVSDEFFFDMSGEPPDDSPRTVRTKEHTVPTLDFGYLQLRCDAKWQSTDEAATQPLTMQNGLARFSQTYPNHKKLILAMSLLLYDLEKQILTRPNDLGIFTVDVAEVAPLALADFHPVDTAIAGDHWEVFCKKRDDFFAVLQKNSPRDSIECADWSSRSLVARAMEYAQAYVALLQQLQQQPNMAAQLALALSVDSVIIRLSGQRQTTEEALVTLPTHPMRVAWYLGYTQLLQKWQRSLEEMAPSQRKKSFNEQWIRQLEPNNVPFFSWHCASKQSFVFFKNLLFFHGIAVPISVPDPNRFFRDIAMLMGIEHLDDIQTDSLPKRLKMHFERFQELHPYVTTQCMTLINPDRGVEVAEALQDLLTTPPDANEEDSEEQITKYAITAYVADEHLTTLHAFDDVQETLARRQTQASSYFTPNLALTVRPLGELAKKDLPDAHLAIVMDYTDGMFTTCNARDIPEATGIALNGLMIRLDPVFTVDEDGLTWSYALSIPQEQKFETVQFAAKFGDVLIAMYRVFMEAGGYHLSQQHCLPVLRIHLNYQRMEQLELFHRTSNWVITMDRFITLDYYDSPYLPHLSDLARKYVVDYSPEVVENIGHRCMVTTAWQTELHDILGNIIADLGLTQVEKSVGHLLQSIKMISGRLALNVLDSPASAAGIVGLGIIALWLQREKLLQKGILIPVDSNQQLFWSDNEGKNRRRCDLLLVTLGKSTFEFTFIEVKWRRNATALKSLADDMAHQVTATAQEFEDVYQNEAHIDTPLRRAYLNNVIRFYLHRARRYQLISEETVQSFYELLAFMEKKISTARVTCKGFIVVPDSITSKPTFTPTNNGRKVEITAISADILSTPLIAIDATSSASGIRDQQEQKPAGHGTGIDSTPEPVQSVDLAPNLAEDAGSEILLGEAQGTPIVWNPGVKGNPHLFIIGIPGQGKSWTMTRILLELSRVHVPSLILDFHGQFAERESPYMQHAHSTVFDAAVGLPFSPFECSEEDVQNGWKNISYQLAEIIARVTDLGEMQQDTVYQAIKESYEAHGNARTFDPADIPTLEEVLKRMARLERQNRISNVVARCRALFEMDLFKPTSAPINLIASIQAGLVIDLHRVPIEQVQVGAGAFILNKIYRDMFRWGQSDHLRLAIILDEAHRLARDITLPRIMKEGRKFGIAVVVASQSMRDFHQDILPNAGTKICFRINHPESRQIAAFLGKRNQEQMIERIQKLGVGQAFVQTSEMESAKLATMLPPT